MLLNAWKREMCLHSFFSVTVDYTCGVFKFYFILLFTRSPGYLSTQCNGQVWKDHHNIAMKIGFWKTEWRNDSEFQDSHCSASAIIHRKLYFIRTVAMAITTEKNMVGWIILLCVFALRFQVVSEHLLQINSGHAYGRTGLLSPYKVITNA